MTRPKNKKTRIKTDIDSNVSRMLEKSTLRLRRGIYHKWIYGDNRKFCFFYQLPEKEFVVKDDPVFPQLIVERSLFFDAVLDVICRNEAKGNFHRHARSACDGIKGLGDFRSVCDFRCHS